MGNAASRTAKVLDWVFDHTGLFGLLGHIVWEPFRKRSKTKTDVRSGDQLDKVSQNADTGVMK